MAPDVTQKPDDISEISSKLAFTRKLQGVTNKIHATKNVDEIMLEVSKDICALFEADRLTIYTLNEEKNAIISKVKTGLNAFKDLKLPISAQSIAGYVAFHKRLVNIADVYDDEELKRHSPQIRFLKEVDQKTGYRTKQMLVVPILDAEDGDLMGVIQMINTLSGLPFPQVAEEGAVELAKTLSIAFNQRQQPLRLVKSKFDALITESIISAGELELASRSARKKSLPLEDVLIDEFQVSLDALGKAYAAFFHVPYEPYKADRIKPADLLANLKRDYIETSQWLPLEDGPEGLIVLTPDPEMVGASRVVNNVFPKHKINYRVCSHREFLKHLDLFFGAEGMMGGDSSSIGDLLSNLDEGHEEGEEGADDMAAAADNELVKLVNKIIVDGYNKKASDIHVEPFPGKEKTEIRYRIDGSLVPYIQIPASYRNALVTRLKIMCDLDISEKRKPQDGKIKFKKFGPLDIELRVATVPTQGGVEDVVMRILASGEPLPLEKMGFSQRNHASLLKCIEKPYGLFFVCGPTGSGKTTTLHSVLKYLNTSETKIWTAEDPVEITQRGLRQVQMNPKAGLNFATAMKAFLRADPDIIMVGEMRDAETTGIGIEASLTGHLVFATLHTNSAPESIIRLLDMGMDPFNFADALLGILAQRLGKRLCGKCKKSYTPSAEEMDSLVSEYSLELQNTTTWKKDPQAARQVVLEEWKKSFANDKGQFTLYNAEGCEECNNTGYKGRVGLHELLVGTDAVKKLIQEHARVAEILAQALEDGMRTLKQDGIEKVLQGITDIKQVRAVCIK